jgi:DNA-binding IclR family transcriptional regulator
MTLPKRSGTQSIERTFRIIREVASHYHYGARLTDVARLCELDKGTTRRVLACLVRERVIDQRASDSRYVPGPLLFELGLAVPAYRTLQDACRAPMERAARRCKGASFVYLRSGAEVVCLSRFDYKPVKGAWAQPGTRRWMASLAAGLAILVELPSREGDAIVDAYFKLLATKGDVRVDERRSVVERSRAIGLGINDGKVAHGLASVAVPIRDAAGTPFASLSIVCDEGPFDDARLEEVVAALRVDAALIEQSTALLLESGRIVSPDPA